MTDSFFIEAEGKKYRQEYLSADEGLRLHLMVLKSGCMPILQVAVTSVGESDARSAMKKIAESAELQGHMLAAIYEAIQKLEYDDVLSLKNLLLKKTFLQRDGELPAELPVSSLPKHFETVKDSARLYVLIGKSVKEQLAPLFQAQIISRISGRTGATE